MGADRSMPAPDARVTEYRITEHRSRAGHANTSSSANPASGSRVGSGCALRRRRAEVKIRVGDGNGRPSGRRYSFNDRGNYLCGEFDQEEDRVEPCGSVAASPRMEETPK